MIQKKNVCVIALLVGVLLQMQIGGLLNSSLNIMSNYVPISAETSSIDFTFPDGYGFARYSGKSYGDYCEIHVMVASSSKTMPTEVYARFGNKNYALEPYYIMPDSAGLNILSNKIEDGMYFGTVLSDLPNDNYSVQFFASNGMKIFSTNSTLNATFEVNEDINLLSPSKYSYGYSNLHTNDIQFYFRYFNPCYIPSTVYLNIEGGSYKMTWENRDSRFYYTYSFPLETNKTIPYNMTFSIDKQSNTTLSKNCTILPIAQEIQYTNNWLTKTNINSSNQYVIFQYKNWENRAPEDIILQINNENTTVNWEVNPSIHFYLDGSFEEMSTDWRYIQTISLMNYPITFINATTYNISVWINNGTKYYEEKVWDNHTYYSILPHFNFEYLNNTIYQDSDGSYNLNVTVNITTTHPNIISLSVYIDKLEGPSFSDNYVPFWTQNWFGTPQNGIVFTSSQNIDTIQNLIFGEVGYVIAIYYSYIIDDTWYSDTYYTSPQTITVTSTNSSQGDYGVKAGDWFIFDSFTSTEYSGPSSCRRISESDNRFLYEIVNIGREYGGDYIDSRSHIWIPSSETWSNSIPGLSYHSLDRPGITRTYIIPNDPDTYDFFIIPDRGIDYFYSQLINDTKAGYFKLSRDTISGSWEIGAWSASLEIKFSSKGVLEYYSYTESLNEKTYKDILSLLSVGKGELPTNSGSITNAFSGLGWFVIIGVLGVTSVFLLKKSGFIRSSSP